MSYLVSGMLVIVAIIHLMPLMGVLGSDRLSQLYGIAFDEPNLVILMRHRAVLFGLLGAFFLLAAGLPVYQPAAFISGFVSVLSYLYLVRAVGGSNAALRRVYKADIVALVCLIIGAVAYLVKGLAS